MADNAADTRYYAIDIARFQRGDDHGFLNPFWDFGHLLWRPLGWLLLHWFRGLTPYTSAGEETFAATALLGGVSLLSGMVCAVLFYAITSRLLKAPWKALLAVAGFISFSPFLDYAHAGTSYITGLMWLLASLWAALRATDSESSSQTFGFLSGAFFALSMLFWFPYFVVFPGVLAAAMLWKGASGAIPAQRRLRLASIIVASTVAVVGIAYLAAISQLGIWSVAELKTWIASSSHGWSQSKQIVRLATGLPRGFFHTGDDGLFLKRFVLKDPYAPVSLGGLVGHLWKLILFYVLALPLTWCLSRAASGRRVFWICAAATIPMLAFAIFVFEPGSQERFLPLYPFVCLGVALLLSEPGKRMFAPAIAGAFLAAAFAINVSAYWKPAVEARIAPEVARVESLQGRVSKNSMVAMVTLGDSAYQFTNQFPLHAVNRRGALPVYDVVEIANVRVTTWKQDFAKHALETMQRSETVWVSSRLLAERPDPAWNWNEGDDPRISWKDLPPFFRSLSYSEPVGGADGFLKLTPSEDNIRKLEAAAKT
jgi:hypothetical protein